MQYCGYNTKLERYAKYCGYTEVKRNAIAYQEEKLMKYVALDVETANADYSSICQIGIALFEDSEVTDTWSSLVNPEDYFDPFNISIHGITEKDVKKAPIFPEIIETMRSFTTAYITVHHMPFDKVAITRAATKYSLPSFKVNWLDSARVARRTWQEFAHKGYGLSNIAAKLAIKFKHHDALEDAIAAGKIVALAIAETGIDLEQWCKRVDKPITTLVNTKIALQGNTDGPLYGENLVFTGALSVPRRQAAEIAAAAGCNVSNSVNTQTTILVVGTQDIRKLKGKSKSSKQIKAEELLLKGVDIWIISEDDLFAMVEK
jgi:DNA polymerase-3 subunit epsilon